MTRLPVVSALLLFTATPALAQPAAPAAPAGAPGAAAPPTDAPAEPKLPEIDDPMLAAPPAPAHTLGSWRDALGMIRARASSLQLAQAKVEQATAQERQALARALPRLTGTGRVNRHLITGEGFYFGASGLTQGTIPNPLTTWSANLDLSVPLFAPQAWYDTGSAKRARRAAELDVKETERLVLAQVADAIVTAVTAERLAEVSRVSLGAALSTLDLTQGRARLGAATAIDVLRAEQEVALARAQIVSATESVRQTREALGLAMGSDEPYGVSPSITLDSLAGDAARVCHADPNVESRPDVRAAKAEVEVAERNVDSVDWQYLPTVDLVSDLGYQSYERANPNGRHLAWSIGGVLSWQLYDGGLRYGQRAMSQGSLRIARQQLGETRRQATVQVAQAERAVTVAEATLTVSRKSRELAAENARLSKLAFMNGAGTSFDLVDAAKRLREAELDLAIKEFGVVRARLAALLALSTCDV
ncbi:MAG: TolC family protein [Sorangiineae bacterium]|nr:TolC family protein [Polyangiaceae bacterium]MEB2322477.1 TolC family protein [Sorangiineae bacterium]